jgi:heme iron utilization protein
MGDAGGKSPILGTTAEAVRLARTLLRTARSASLAVLEPETGWPMVSRVGMSTDLDGAPILLLSGLAVHTEALRSDPRCSLLIGPLGKGDPLAHPRLSLVCTARELQQGSPEAEHAAERYLAHQPKAQLYAGLPDFRYVALAPQRGALNGGFGKAYVLDAGELISSASFKADLAALEPSAIAHMNEDHAEAVGLYAQHFAKAPAGDWRMIGIDPEGMTLANGDDVRRVWFDTPLTSAMEVRRVLSAMADTARRAMNVR